MKTMHINNDLYGVGDWLDNLIARIIYLIKALLLLFSDHLETDYSR